MKPAVKRPETLLVERDGRGVVRLTLNRPEIRNAFDGTLINDLTATLDQLAADRETRVLVLTGAGEAFSAGAELGWMRSAAEQGDRENFQDALRLAELMRRLDDMPMPTIARVNGAAMGGGVGLTACCDMAVAVEGAVFALSEVRLGIIPGAISPYVLRAIGPHEARRYFLTGERFDAATARRIGLVNEVVSDEGLDAAVEDLVGKLLASGPKAVRAAKDLIAHVALKEIDDLLIRDTAQRIADQRAGAEAREGLDAFLEKRKPRWSA
ncbi:enoyl-CoA hydratase/isomerase family protein [Thalassobaculum sp.]|uniref:enoyl-CoA hydratase/isomerase family protein n=1 Tax=Thalassobaculum sp. TaxID=2022740 RepID=UPI0032EB7DEE